MSSEAKSATSVDPDTGLATDFLNQYNEVTMTLEMVPDMPELLEELLSWTPKSYEAHFNVSRFHDREAVIDAYRDAPTLVRARFDRTTAELNDALTSGLRAIKQLLADGTTREELDFFVARVTKQALSLMQKLNAIIHGAETDDVSQTAGQSAQQDIDALFAS